MPKKRAKDTLRKKPATKRLKRLFLVATEGKRTEVEYFRMDVFREKQDCTVKFVQRTKPNRTNPESVLRRMDAELRKCELGKGDQAWIVVDIDGWKPNEIEMLRAWQAKSDRFRLGVSNPKFELFLLMHFENANGCITGKEVESRLKKYLPHYGKGIAPGLFSIRCILRRVCYAVPCAAATPFHGRLIRVNAISARQARGARAPLLA